MAVMSTNDRTVVHVELMQELSQVREPCNILKADGLAAVGAIDQWVSDNMTSFNNALPAPATTALTSSQKARLLLRVVKKRFDLGV